MGKWSEDRNNFLSQSTLTSDIKVLSLVRTRSSILPLMWVGWWINRDKLRSKVKSQKRDENLLDPVIVSKSISGKSKSPMIINLW